MITTARRLTLLVHAATRSVREAAFGQDEPIDAAATAHAAALRDRMPRAAQITRAPDRACAGTSAALGLDATPDPALRGWDAGRWAGRTLDEVAADEPDALGAWLSDPAATPHGGESLDALLDRVRELLGSLPAGHTLAVCGPAVARAAVVVAMGARPSGFWRVDAGPLTVTDLRGGPDRWTVRSTGAGP